MERWTGAAARAWGEARPWICGVNFLPSSAVNFLEMWRAQTFDRETIARELGFAAQVGFNAVRVNPHWLVWRHDRDGLLERLDWLLGVAAGLGIDVVPCLFDDCGFGGQEPREGPQPDPIPGVHNSRAVANPGRTAVCDPAGRPGLEAYLRDVVRSFRTDPRILFWDLYNEPGNRMIFTPDGFAQDAPGLEAHSLALMEACFRWAREEAPVQPLTVAAWSTPPPGSAEPPYATAVDRAALALSDIVSFHAYRATADVAAFLDTLAAEGRPIVCSEWMARPIGSRITEQMPLFYERGVGCFQWGLVRGRTQTYLPWPEPLVRAHGGVADRSVWFHDLLEPDGRPYDSAEIATIRSLTGRTS